MAATAKFKKDMVVKVKVEREAWGEHPARCATLWRRCTEEEVQAWRDSDDSKGMNCAGETKLPPRDTYRRGTTPDEMFKVVRARVSAPRGWGNPVPKCALVEDADGAQWYVRRRDLH
ncbi:MAG: hypothetical protein HKO53_15390 [Gemmatimonadetes bacterium]|nr:hypothetical protein [Gemmatimonadota bacterium]